MLFWLFVIILAVGVGCVILEKWMYHHTSYDTGWLEVVGYTIIVLAAIAIFISGVIMLGNHYDVDANVATSHERYKSLTYQLENNLYDNDNDLGKKELYDEIREWNEDLAYYQNIQDNFWFGIYHPNVYDQFEFINYNNINTKTEEIYPATMTVTEINTEQDIVILTDSTGHVWEFYGVEDWEVGDICSCIMDTNGTEIITDDKIISTRYN